MSYIIELTMGFDFVTVGVSLLSYSQDVFAGKSTLRFDCISIGEFLLRETALSQIVRENRPERYGRCHARLLPAIPRPSSFHRPIIFTMSHSWVLMRVYLLNDRGVNCLCEAFMPLLHHASSRLNLRTSLVMFKVFARASMLHGFIQQDWHQCCTFLGRSRGVPWFVLLSKLCLC